MNDRPPEPAGETTRTPPPRWEDTDPTPAVTVPAPAHPAEASSVAEPDPALEARIPPSPHRPVAEREAWRDPRERGEMSFVQHLDELRVVLVHVVIASGVGAIGGWFLSPFVLEDLIRRTVGVAVVLSPIEALDQRIKLTLLLGLLIAGPYVFYKAWQFIVPGLFKRERSLVLPMALGSMLLFASGAAVAYFYVVPLILDVLQGFKTPGMLVQIRLSDLLTFFYNVSIACGVIMQLPLVTMTLTAIGLVTPVFLLRQWRYAVVGGFLLTALITPGDVITAQLILGGPMVALYFISVGLSWLVARRRHDEREEDPSGRV